MSRILARNRVWMAGYFVFALGVLSPCLALRGAPTSCCRTEVMFFFDAEDYTGPHSADALRDLANLFHEEGYVVHVAMVGHLARQLDMWGRDDVRRALGPHQVGTQSLYHSRHPNVLELSDGADYAAAYARVRKEETEGVRLIEGFTGKRVTFAVPPGDSKSYVAMDVYADLGLSFYCDTVVEDGRCGDLHFANLRHYDYSRKVELESLIPSSDSSAEPDLAALADRIAEDRRVLLYLHPCMAVCREFWDGVNFNRTNLHALAELQLPERRPAADTAVYQARLRKLLRMLKTDGRFVFPTLAEKIVAEKPRVPITEADIPRIAHEFRREFGPVASPSWSVADIFQAAVRLLRGEKPGMPGKAYGFLDAPYVSPVPVTLEAADLRVAARGIDLSRHLPAVVEVGDVKVGPGEFLLAALFVLSDGASTVTVPPTDSLRGLEDFPRLRDFRPAGQWVFTSEFKDAFTSDRLRRQFWTLRYE